MVEFVRSFEERVAAEREKAPQIVEDQQVEDIQRVIDAFDNFFHNIEYTLTEVGMHLDKESDDALAVLKHKLSDLKENA